jgi:hypothetical protein
MSDGSCFHTSPVHAHASEHRGVCVEGESVFAPPREEYRQAGSGLGDATLAH